MNADLNVVQSFIKTNQKKWFSFKFYLISSFLIFTFSFSCNFLGVIDTFYPQKESTLASLYFSAFLLFGALFIYYVTKALKKSNDKIHITKLIEDQNREFKDSLNAINTFNKNESSFIYNLLVSKTSQLISNFDKKIVLKNESAKNIKYFLFFAVILTTTTIVFTQNSLIKAKYGFQTILGSNQSPIEVNPGDIEVPKFTSFKISVKWLRPYECDNDISILINYESGKKENIKMHSTNKGVFVYQHYDSNESFKYQIISSQFSSNVYSVRVYELPTLLEQEVTVTPPLHTGLPPVTYKEFSYITVPQNSRLIYKIKTNKPVDGWLVNKTSQFKLNKNEKNTYFYQHLATEYMEYNLLLKDKEEHEYKTMPDYILEVIPDLEPVVEVTNPSNDIDILGVEILDINFVAKDDYGINEAKLIIESPNFKTKEIDISLTKIENNKDFTKTVSLDLIDFGLNNGDLISFYIRIKDNCEPSPHYAISTPRILNVIPGKVKKDKDNNNDNKEDDQKDKKDIHFDDIVAELKRIYRETLKLNSISDLEDYKEKTNILANALSDLNVNFIRRVEPILNITQQQPDHPINGIVLKIKESLKVTENLMRDQSHSASSSHQLKALQLLNEFIAMLSKDQKAQGKGQGKQDEQKDDQKDKKEELAQKIKDWLNELKDLKSRNDTITNNLSKNEGSMNENEKQYFSDRKNDIKQQLQQINEEMQSNKEVFNASDFLNQASRELTNQIQNIQKGNRAEAIKFDAKANWHIEKAIEGLEKLNQKSQSNDLSGLSDKANDILGEQQKLLSESKNENASKEQQRELSKKQDEISNQLNELQKEISKAADKLEQHAPLSSETLQKISEELKKNDVERKMSKSSKYMFYGFQDKSANEQSEILKSLNQMKKDIETAKDQMGDMSKQKMMETLKDFQDLQDDKRKTDAQKAQAMQKTIESNSGKDTPQFLKDIMMLAEELKSGEPGKTGITANELLTEAMNLLDSKIKELENKELLKKRIQKSTPPVGYEKSVEDYFKNLGNQNAE